MSEAASTASSISAVKKRIRDLSRSLEKDKERSHLPATKRNEMERALKAHERELEVLIGEQKKKEEQSQVRNAEEEEKVKAESENQRIERLTEARRMQEKKERRKKGGWGKYKMVRFFEKQKAERKIKQYKRIMGEPNCTEEKKKQFTAKLEQAILELKYIMDFPTQEKYVALYKEADEKGAKRREEIMTLLKEGKEVDGKKVVKKTTEKPVGNTEEAKSEDEDVEMEDAEEKEEKRAKKEKKEKKDKKDRKEKKSKDKKAKETVVEDDGEESDGGFFEK